MSSAYLRLLIFHPAILNPASASSSPAFLMMYSAYKLNKQGDNIKPWCTHFPVFNHSIISCRCLTLASWSAYRFLRRQIRRSDILISLRISLIHYDPHSQRLSCSQWSKSIWFPGILLLFILSIRCWQFDLWFFCLFYIQLESQKIFICVRLKPSLNNFEHYFARMWDECNCTVVWTFFGSAFLWD